LEPGAAGDAPRTRVLARQVIEDTALKVVVEPVHSAVDLTTSSVHAVCRISREFLAKRLLIPLSANPLPVLDDRPTLDPEQLEGELFLLTRRPLRPAAIALDIEGKDSLLRLEGLIEGATCSIDVLMYMWDCDPLGWDLARKLAGAAARIGSRPGGAPAVRILIDGGGNLIHGPPEFHSAGEANEVVGWLARQPHVEVLRTRNPMATFDHRKLVLFDGTAAWSGGRNFTLSSFFEYHDLSYTIRGPLIPEMVRSYEKGWTRSGGRPRPREVGPREAPDANAQARVVGTSRKRKDLSQTIYLAVDHAMHHVYLENPYFTDNTLFCKLARARQRGVDVRVIYAQDSQSDILDRAMRATANRLMRAGVRVYLHPGTTHVKAASVDGKWAYFGTGNFDNLSLRRNREIGVTISAGPVVDEIEHRLFERDLHSDWELKEPPPVSIRDYLSEIVANLVL
jgi:phosphatidylserine/phosphatidylglycerophosphate/cardiolipin synthase-like enzyme